MATLQHKISWVVFIAAFILSSSVEGFASTILKDNESFRDDSLSFRDLQLLLDASQEDKVEISAEWMQRFTKIESHFYQAKNVFYAWWVKPINDSVSLAAFECQKNDSLFSIIVSFSNRGAEIEHLAFLKHRKFPRKILYHTQIYFGTAGKDTFTTYQLKTKDQNIIHPDQAKIIKTTYWRVMPDGHFCSSNRPLKNQK